MPFQRRADEAVLNALIDGPMTLDQLAAATELDRETVHQSVTRLYYKQKVLTDRDERTGDWRYRRPVFVYID